MSIKTNINIDKIWELIARFSVVIIGLPFALFLQKRAFVIGFVIAGFVNWLLIIKSKNNKTTTLLFALISVLITFILAFVFKLNSSLGRLFIYKISFQIFKKNWFSGIGLGNFKTTYLFQQAGYFAKGNFTTIEQQLADNTFYAFNDYWQFVVETGIIGAVLVIAVLFIIAKQIYTASRSQQFVILKSIVISLLVCLLVAAFFTHIFENQGSQYVLILYVTALIALNKHNKVYKYIYFALVSVLLLWTLNKSILKYQVEANYKKSIYLYMAGLKEESLIELNKIRPLEDNKRAVLYLQILLSNQNLVQESEINYLIKKYPNAQTYKLLGDYYLANQSYHKAENAYILSINMVPNRFLPRQSLLRLYILQNNLIAAIKIAKEIISLQVKVDSYQIRLIKDEAKNFLIYHKQA